MLSIRLLRDLLGLPCTWVTYSLSSLQPERYECAIKTNPVQKSFQDFPYVKSPYFFLNKYDECS